MTPEERRILRPVITNVAHHNENAWWELKREIFDRGFQTYYQAQDEFAAAASTFLAQLPESDKNALVADWRKRTLVTDWHAQESVLKNYQWVVIEEVVSRATAAANRTITW